MRVIRAYMKNQVTEEAVAVYGDHRKKDLALTI